MLAHHYELAFVTAVPVVGPPRPATSLNSVPPSFRRLPPLPSRKRTRQSPHVPAPPPCAVAGVDPTPPDTTSTPTTASATPTLDPLLRPRDRRRFVFFGGKGGVGKTSTSAAVAVRSADAGLSTLIISTDPAHSLGDALRHDLSDGRIHRVDDALPLYAIESDTREAVETFRNVLSSLRAPTDHDAPAPDQADGSGNWAAVADRLGLQEFADVFETIPPGADELIALVAVLDLVQAEQPDVSFDRILIDTAPTGHTLRFLAFPDFLDKFLAQALSLREKLASARGVMGSVTQMFMGGRAKRASMSAALEEAARRVEQYREKMVQLSDLFRDPEQAEFVVVTIGTGLAVAESSRLIDHLWDEGIWVRYTVMNQVLPSSQPDTMEKYLSRVRKGQASEIAFATEQIADEFGLTTHLVPRFDTEVRGVYGLRALSMVAFPQARRNAYGRLFDETSMVNAAVMNSQFMFVGGKGGVGKTSMSASLGVALAEAGMKTLVLSTDPAHSLADALQIDLEGGRAVEVQDATGELFAMEIDTRGAIEELKTLAKEFVAEGQAGIGVDIARRLGLEEFASLLDNTPPGIDELVALTQVIELVKFGDFDRVVVDTAPTGHTLRLLSFPDFLESFLGKVIRLKQRLDGGLATLRTMLGRREQTTDVVERAAKGISKLRDNMIELRDLVGDKERTQFSIVTVPTGLAMVESERLVKQLRKDGIEVNNLIINQIVPDDGAEDYVRRIARDQDKCIEELRTTVAEKKIELVEVPFFDVEVRGVYGLRAMNSALFDASVEDE